ncbi:Ig-like domain-containing protein [Pseudomonas sp. LB3P14]
MRTLCALALWTAAGAQAVAAQLVPAAVQPSGPEVPANLLRISLVFAQPVGEPVLPRLELRQANGNVIDKPFFEQELWSPTGKILTVLLHPGRVKSGLIAHDTVGPVLHADGVVVLMLDGLEIKRWKVGSDDLDGPRPSGWSITSVRAGTREPLVVELDAPIDGRDVDYLAVANSSNRRVRGRARLEVGEKRWTFTPDVPWDDSRYTLAVFGNLEDPSGNRLNGHFESPGTAPESTTADVYIPLAINPALVKRQQHP